MVVALLYLWPVLFQILFEFRPNFGQILAKFSNFDFEISSEILPKNLKFPKFGHFGQGRKKTQTENQNTVARVMGGVDACLLVLCRWSPTLFMF